MITENYYPHTRSLPQLEYPIREIDHVTCIIGPLLGTELGNMSTLRQESWARFRSKVIGACLQ